MCVCICVRVSQETVEVDRDSGANKVEGESEPALLRDYNVRRRQADMHIL